MKAVRFFWGPERRKEHFFCSGNGLWSIFAHLHAARTIQLGVWVLGRILMEGCNQHINERAERKHVWHLLVFMGLADGCKSLSDWFYSNQSV